MSITCEIISNPRVPSANVSWEIHSTNFGLFTRLGRGHYAALSPTAARVRVTLNRALFLKRLDYVLVLRVFGARGESTTKNFTIDFSGRGGRGRQDDRLHPAAGRWKLLMVVVVVVVVVVAVVVAGSCCYRFRLSLLVVVGCVVL